TARIGGADGRKIGGEQRADVTRQLGVDQPTDAVAPFTGADGGLGGEIVEAGARMGGDHAEGRRLLAEMHQDAGEHRMLEHVGEVAGVEGVTIVHRAFLRPAQQPAKYATQAGELWRCRHRRTGRLPRFTSAAGQRQPARPGDQPRTRGISTWSRRQARWSTSLQSRNLSSLLRQMRTSLSRLASQPIAIPSWASPGLAAMNASSTSPGVTVLGSLRSRKSFGIFTVARALRMVSK